MKPPRSLMKPPRPTHVFMNLIRDLYRDLFREKPLQLHTARSEEQLLLLDRCPCISSAPPGCPIRRFIGDATSALARQGLEVVSDGKRGTTRGKACTAPAPLASKNLRESGPQRQAVRR